MKKPTMTLSECVKEMRAIGVKTQEARIADGIEAGRYPFGALVGVSDRTGRRTFEIWRVDFERWLKSITPAE